MHIRDVLASVEPEPSAKHISPGSGAARACLVAALTSDPSPPASGVAGRVVASGVVAAMPAAITPTVPTLMRLNRPVEDAATRPRIRENPSGMTSAFLTRRWQGQREGSSCRQVGAWLHPVKGVPAGPGLPCTSRCPSYLPDVRSVSPKDR